MAKYKVGDWCHDGSTQNKDYFWKIADVYQNRGEVGYGVAFMLDTHESLEFRNWGNYSFIREHKLRPVVDAIDLLRCKLSDVQTVYLEAQREADRLKADVDALLRSQSLLIVS